MRTLSLPAPLLLCVTLKHPEMGSCTCALRSIPSADLFDGGADAAFPGTGLNVLDDAGDADESDEVDCLRIGCAAASRIRRLLPVYEADT